MDNESKLFIWRETGADPEIVVRGIQLSKTFDKQAKKKEKRKKKKKKNGRKRGRGCGGSFPPSEVLFISIFHTIIYIQVYFR